MAGNDSHIIAQRRKASKAQSTEHRAQGSGHRANGTLRDYRI